MHARCGREVPIGLVIRTECLRWDSDGVSPVGESRESLGESPGVTDRIVMT